MVQNEYAIEQSGYKEFFFLNFFDSLVFWTLLFGPKTQCGRILIWSHWLNFLNLMIYITGHRIWPKIVISFCSFPNFREMSTFSISLTDFLLFRVKISSFYSTIHLPLMENVSKEATLTCFTRQCYYWKVDKEEKENSSELWRHWPWNCDVTRRRHAYQK